MLLQFPLEWFFVPSTGRNCYKTPESNNCVIVAFKFKSLEFSQEEEQETSQSNLVLLYMLSKEKQC